MVKKMTLRIWRYFFAPKVQEGFTDRWVVLSMHERAAHAKELLRNPIFTEAYEQLRTEAMRLWEETGIKESDKREFLWRHLKALNQMKMRLERFVKDAAYQEEVNKRQAPYKDAA